MDSSANTVDRYERTCTQSPSCLGIEHPTGEAQEPHSSPGLILGTACEEPPLVGLKV